MVERIVRATEITPLPLAPPVVLGAIDVAGEILPVLDVRARFRLPERRIDPAHQFLIARTARRGVVLHIDAALGVIERPISAIFPSARLAPDLAHIRGVIPLEDGLLLIQDLEQFLSPQEERALDHAMTTEHPPHAP
jgi:purine-binding chemotaxis protein CheW